MKILLLALLTLSLTGLAFGSHLDGIDPPSSLIVSRGGLEWVWASPCAPQSPSCGTTPIDSHHGWVLPTAAQWTASFTDVTHDLYNAFNPASGQLCASAYFNSGYDHCDNVNVNGQGANVAVWQAPFTDNPNPNVDYAETFLVRGGAVPEPSTWALLGTAALAGLLRKRFKR